MAGREDSSELQRRLERLSAALGQTAEPLTKPAPVPAPAHTARTVGRGGMVAALALLTVAIATGRFALMVPAALLALFSGALLLRGVGEAVLSALPAGIGPKDPSRAHIGLGASIAADAVIEPGAVVEMGATVGPGVHLKRGAVVRMGATVRDHAVLEEGAVVGWGADVKSGAVLGEGAIVGAGATVHKGAQVPAGSRLLPGADWAGSASAGAGAGAGPGAPRATAKPASATDPRLTRIGASCERIDAELRQAPEAVRDFLGATADTASALRSVCMGLVEREKVLRAESSAEALAFLDQEERELQRRIEAATDERVAHSLRSAVDAIEQQKRQRSLLRTSADRLDAELTRLQWTLDAMATQLVRLRVAGTEATSAPTSEALQTVQQLHDEIDAITEALEHTARAPDLQPVVNVAPEEAGTPPGRDRNRTR